MVLKKTFNYLTQAPNFGRQVLSDSKKIFFCNMGTFKLAQPFIVHNKVSVTLADNKHR